MSTNQPTDSPTPAVPPVSATDLNDPRRVQVQTGAAVSNTNELVPPVSADTPTPRTDAFYGCPPRSSGKQWQTRGTKEELDFARTLEAENARLRDVNERYLRHMRDKIYVDATPDAELPARILAAYIDDQTTAESIPPELGNLMNKWQAERNAIVRKALADLAALTAANARVEELEHQVTQYEAVLSERDRLQESLTESIAKHYETHKEAQSLRTRITALEEQLGEARKVWVSADVAATWPEASHVVSRTPHPSYGFTYEATSWHRPDWMKELHMQHREFLLLARRPDAHGDEP